RCIIITRIIVFYRTLPPPSSTLFPYTTLFRSLVFTLDGKEFRIDPILEQGTKDYFIIIKDATSGHETYGAARYLYASPPDANGKDRKSTRLNSSHQIISYAVFCLKKKNKNQKM